MKKLNSLKQFEVWFITGSQHLYGPETLKQVASNSLQIATALHQSPAISVSVIFKPVVTTPEAISSLCQEVNNASQCVGIICWMHTFSPAKMWIQGLRILQKPMLHLHTQFNKNLPWDKIDMDFMNLNQAAHGDREFGFIGTRMRMERKVVVGHWEEAYVHNRIDTWARAACAWQDNQQLRVARFGDNMRHVAVTEGDKVEAQIRLGYSVNGFGVGDLVQSIQSVEENEVNKLIQEYDDLYILTDDLKKGGKNRNALVESARIETGMRNFLDRGGFKAFTTTFEDLHGLVQLPGMAVQRLMADGFGFGAEGDWKTSALVRAMKVMALGLPGGTSFMEDYTYDFGHPMKVLGAHMLEVCPSIAQSKPKVQLHPLGIGGKEDPVRLVFDTAPGFGLNASLVDMGNRFRMIVNTVDVIPPDAPLPNLPVARAVWVPRPNLSVAAEAWIFAGGAHHTGFSQALSVEHIRDYTAMAGIEFILIDQKTEIESLRKEMRWNEVYYHLFSR